MQDIGMKIGRRGFLAGVVGAAAGDVHGVDVKALRGKLRNFGAYLPNALRA